MEWSISGHILFQMVALHLLTKGRKLHIYLLFYIGNNPIIKNYYFEMFSKDYVLKYFAKNSHLVRTSCPDFLKNISSKFFETPSEICEKTWPGGGGR